MTIWKFVLNSEVATSFFSTSCFQVKYVLVYVFEMDNAVRLASHSNLLKDLRNATWFRTRQEISNTGKVSMKQSKEIIWKLIFGNDFCFKHVVKIGNSLAK